MGAHSKIMPHFSGTFTDEELLGVKAVRFFLRSFELKPNYGIVEELTRAVKTKIYTTADEAWMVMVETYFRDSQGLTPLFFNVYKNGDRTYILAEPAKRI